MDAGNEAEGVCYPGRLGNWFPILKNMAGIGLFIPIVNGTGGVPSIRPIQKIAAGSATLRAAGFCSVIGTGIPKTNFRWRIESS